MATYKGIGLIFIREMIEKTTDETKEKFYSQLTETEKNFLKSCLPVTQCPINIADKIVVASSHAIYSNDEYGIRAIAIEMAQAHLKTIYKAIIHYFAFPFFVAKAPLLWSTYYSDGQGRCEKINSNTINFCVSGYPDLPKTFQITATGYMYGMLYSAGLKNFRVALIDNNPKDWKWNIQLEK